MGQGWEWLAEDAQTRQEPLRGAGFRAIDRAVQTRAAFALIAALGAASLACKPKGTVDPSIEQVEPADAWAAYELLEQRIAAGEASEADRVAVLEKVRAAPDDQTAAYAFARAAVAGRAAENRGLAALDIIEEMRTWCLTSIERDPEFQGMAATRMLGTLYVLAGRHLKQGDSEEGLELLESVVDAHADVPVNHLRLAEGYINLGDVDPALESLCVARAGASELSGEERALLDSLIEGIGGADLLPCAAADASGGEGEP